MTEIEENVTVIVETCGRNIQKRSINYHKTLTTIPKLKEYILMLYSCNIKTIFLSFIHKEYSTERSDRPVLSIERAI